MVMARMGASVQSIRCLRILCKEGRLEEALRAAEFMKKQGITLSDGVIYSLLKECSRRKDLAAGRRVRLLIASSGLESNCFLINHLICLFASCGSLKDAIQAFRKAFCKDNHMWTSIMSMHTKHAQGAEAIELYRELRQSDLKPDGYTFATALNACASIGALKEGKLIHADILTSELEVDEFLGSTLVDMYAKCGSINEALREFSRLPKRDAVSWTAMISGYAQCGYGLEALQLFDQMQLRGLKADSVTFLSILKACAMTKSLEQGKLIHAQIMGTGLGLNVSIGNALVDMYAKCGDLDGARRVFMNLQKRDVVSWNVMITGCVQNGLYHEALNLFMKMQEDGFQPNKVTYMCILKACSSIGALDQGKYVHTQLTKYGLDSNPLVGSRLVDMYAKCGNMDRAQEVFMKLKDRDVVTWTAMIDGYAQQGQSQEAVKFYHEMVEEGVKPNKVTFVCVLSACCHGGLMTEGYDIFHSMHDSFGITPMMEHYTCLVDLFGRGGNLCQAQHFIDTSILRSDKSVQAYGAFKG